MTYVRKRHLLSLILAALLIVSGLVAAGCSNTGSLAGSSKIPTPVPSAPASGSAQPFCAAAGQLKASIAALGSADIVRGGIPAITAALTKIQTDLDAFQASAKAQFGPQVSELRTSLASLKTALGDARGSLDIGSLTAIAASVSEIVTSFTALQNAVANRCK